MQCTTGGRDYDVHVSGTLGTFEHWYARFSTHTRGGCLRIWVGYLPGVRGGLQVSAVCSIVQVLTGEIPFRGVRQTELGWCIFHGLRPAKPDNASSIGFSDFLWSFAQRCWDGDRKLRPDIGEVVTRLGKVAADWDGLMPPCLPAESATPDFEGPTSETLEFRKLEVFPQYCSLSNGPGGIFQSSTKTILKSPTKSQAASMPSSSSSELSQEGPQAVVTKPSGDPQSGPRVPTRPRPEPDGNSHVPAISPVPMPRVPMQLRIKEPHDDLRPPEGYVHPYRSPPSQPPVKKRKGFKRYVNLRLPESFKRPSVPPAQSTESVGAGHLTAVTQVESDPMEHCEL